MTVFYFVLLSLILSILSGKCLFSSAIEIQAGGVYDCGKDLLCEVTFLKAEYDLNWDSDFNINNLEEESHVYSTTVKFKVVKRKTANFDTISCGTNNKGHFKIDEQKQLSVMGDCSNITEGIFNNKGIRTVALNTFSKLAKLTKLKFMHNSIEDIEFLKFLPENLPNSVPFKLDLSFNKLRTIKSGTFSRITNFDRLTLEDNSLTTMETGSLDLKKDPSGAINFINGFLIKGNNITRYPLGVFSDIRISWFAPYEGLKVKVDILPQQFYNLEAWVLDLNGETVAGLGPGSLDMGNGGVDTLKLHTGHHCCSLYGLSESYPTLVNPWNHNGKAKIDEYECQLYNGSVVKTQSSDPMRDFNCCDTYHGLYFDMKQPDKCGVCKNPLNCNETDTYYCYENGYFDCKTCDIGYYYDATSRNCNACLSKSHCFDDDEESLCELLEDGEYYKGCATCEPGYSLNTTKNECLQCKENDYYCQEFNTSECILGTETLVCLQCTDSTFEVINGTCILGSGAYQPDGVANKAIIIGCSVGVFVLLVLVVIGFILGKYYHGRQLKRKLKEQNPFNPETAKEFVMGLGTNTDIVLQSDSEYCASQMKTTSSTLLEGPSRSCSYFDPDDRSGDEYAELGVKGSDDYTELGIKGSGDYTELGIKGSEDYVELGVKE